MPFALPASAWITPGKCRTYSWTPHRHTNSWGFHDMHGRVCERVADHYDACIGFNGPVTNSNGPSSGLLRVIKGGYFGYGIDYNFYKAGSWCSLSFEYIT